MLAYHEAGVLDLYYTTFMDHPDYWLSNLIRRVAPPLRSELRRRHAGELPFESIRNFPWREMMRTAASRYASPTMTDRVWEWAELGFDRWVARHLDRSAQVLHLHEHCALFTMQRAAELGLFTVYEQPSQHHAFFTRIAKEQIDRYPELAGEGTQLLIDEKAARRNQRRDQELALTNRIVCNSSFTRRTLTANHIPESKIDVIPLGFPEPVAALPDRNWDRLVFLNAGTQNLRKALHLLYRAWRLAQIPEKDAELWLIGKMNLPESTREGLPGKVTIRESIPQPDLMDLYLKANVFILPTLADGFGMVITEAMSRGLIVITTENSGGPDLITHGVDGLIIPAGSEEAIRQALSWCLENRDKLPDMSRRAWLRAAGWQWSDYRRGIVKLMTNRFEEFQGTRQS